MKNLKERIKYALKEKHPIPTGYCKICSVNFYGKEKKPKDNEVGFKCLRCK